jgi:hypothetical protein
MSRLGAIKYELEDEVDLGKLVKARFAILRPLTSFARVSNSFKLYSLFIIDAGLIGP